MEIYIGWIFPILGLPLSWQIAKGGKKKTPFGKFIYAVVSSIGLVFCLVFASVLANSVCIDFLQICEGHGDGNMSYWFNALFLSPLYFFMILVGISFDNA